MPMYEYDVITSKKGYEKLKECLLEKNYDLNDYVVEIEEYVDLKKCLLEKNYDLKEYYFDGIEKVVDGCIFLRVCGDDINDFNTLFVEVLCKSLGFTYVFIECRFRVNIKNKLENDDKNNYDTNKMHNINLDYKNNSTDLKDNEEKVREVKENKEHKSAIEELREFIKEHSVKEK